MSDNPELDLPELKGVQLDTATAISSLAVNFALKWFDMSLIKDGVLYQQKKMEGQNFHVIDLPDVFEVAKQFENHILASPNRLSNALIDMVTEVLTDEGGEEDESDEQEADLPS